MSRCYIVSVGTSLIANYEKRRSEETTIRNSYYEIRRSELGNPLQNAQTHESILDSNGTYRQAWDNMRIYVKTEATEFNEIASLSAELSSILFWDGKTRIRSKDKIVFIATTTLEAGLCVNLLKKIIEDKWNIIGSGNGAPEISIKINIDGLGMANDPTFGTCGLPNFLTEIVRLVKDNKENHDVILIPTGGYKALIPYMVIAGILEQVPCRYVYEESKNVLELPPLPLHVDFPRWLQIESVVNILEGKTNYEDSKIYQSFCTQLSGLLVPDNSKSPPSLESTGIDFVLRERAKEVGGRPELVVRAANSPLLAFIDDAKLKEKFLRLASIGHLIWKGDRVPEMVDHSLRHHNDLFLLAERVLLPIFYYKPDFLDKHELYALLSALFLHDCGHVIGHITLKDGKNIRLFPTEIRDHHHVLGYLRLKEPDKHGGTGRMMYEALKDDKESGNDLWSGYLHAPAVLGLYHRKKMKMQDKKEYEFFGKTYSCLEDYNGEVEVMTASGSKTIETKKLALMVCLLRIIDGLDEQASRTGSPANVAFHLAQLETEVVQERERGDALETALKKILNKDTVLQEINEAILGHMGGYTQVEGRGIGSRNEPQKKLNASELRKKIDETADQEKVGYCKPLLEEYVHARLVEKFKDFQKSPYGEKVYIREVIVKGENSNGNVRITIDLEMLDDERLLEEYEKAGCPIEIKKDENIFDLKKPDDRESYRKYMLKQLKKEYSAENSYVEKTLKKNGIIFTYKTGE